jgi:replicative DNA helicase
MRDIDPSSYKVPPQNLEAEQSILGGILLENSSINGAQEIISKDDFYSEAHRKIFATITELYDKNEPVDLITLSNALKDKSMLDSVGGTSYLASLVDNVPSAANVANYAKIVKEKAILRGLIGSATDIINSCYATGSDVDEVLDKAEHSIFEISENKVRPSFYPIRDIVKDSFRAIEDLYTRKELITGVPTGFEKIDDLTSGLQKSDLIIIAGRPSMGKTSLALNIAQFASMENKIPVAIFS